MHFFKNLYRKAVTFFNAPLRYAGILSKELIEYTKAIVHNLISRSFIENWGQKTFIEHFERQILWMKNGLKSRGQSGFRYEIKEIDESSLFLILTK